MSLGEMVRNFWNNIHSSEWHHDRRAMEQVSKLVEHLHLQKTPSNLEDNNHTVLTVYKDGDSKTLEYGIPLGRSNERYINLFLNQGAEFKVIRLSIKELGNVIITFEGQGTYISCLIQDIYNVLKAYLPKNS